MTQSNWGRSSSFMVFSVLLLCNNSLNTCLYHVIRHGHTKFPILCKQGTFWRPANFHCVIEASLHILKKIKGNVPMTSRCSVLKKLLKLDYPNMRDTLTL